MEIKINKEIRDFTEAVFFGLCLRELLFSICGIAASAALYFLLRQHINTDILTWLCMAAALPFAALGFVRYNGMRAEALIAAWVRAEVLIPKKLPYSGVNIYASAFAMGAGKRRRSQ